MIVGRMQGVLSLFLGIPIFSQIGAINSDRKSATREGCFFALELLSFKEGNQIWSDLEVYHLS